MESMTMVMITEKMRPIKVRGVTCSKSGSEATPIAAYGIPKRKTLYVKPFWTNLEQEQKAEGSRGGEMLSTRHEPVYHATHGCQAASLSLTTARLRGLF